MQLISIDFICMQLISIDFNCIQLLASACRCQFCLILCGFAGKAADALFGADAAPQNDSGMILE
jgi:hypothetical protein